jgi:hypothetical protein
MGLLFIPQVICMESHGDDASWEKLLTHPPELSYQQRIWEQVGGMDGVRIVDQYLRYVNGSLTYRKIS